MSKKTFCNLLDEGINDETKASPWYRKLIEVGIGVGVADSDLSKITDIRHDEIEHRVKLKNIRSKYCKVR